MRIAILSDVHANLEALTEVERTIAERGRRPGGLPGRRGRLRRQPQRVLRASSAGWPAVTLLGNHDAAVTGRMDYAFYYDAARHALDWTAGPLRPEHLDWLAGAALHPRAIGDVGFSHGSPRRARGLRLHLGAASRRPSSSPSSTASPQVTFIGHSHLTKVFALQAGSEVVEVLGPQVPAAPRLQVRRHGGLRWGSRATATTGPASSSTTPRSGAWSTCRVPYDIETSAQRIFAAKVAVNFGRRLFLGV